MSKLVPLKFKPFFKEKIWGGQKIKTILGKDFGNLENCGETWELSGVSGNISTVASGPFDQSPLDHLINEFKGELIGEKIYNQFGNEFPLLIKFIDAADDLSIQVHPDDELAKKRHNGFGKTEMWYILDADPEATLISGFNRTSYKEEYLEFFESGRLTEILNREEVFKGDVFFIPAGRVHTIGKGIMLAEIQQTSDITYRIYDFDRKDKFGIKRELHVKEALDAIDFSPVNNYKTPYKNDINQANQILSNPFFTCNKIVAGASLTRNLTSLDCFKIYIGVGGQGQIAGESIRLGEVMLVPASFKDFQIEPEGRLELLEVYIE